MSTEIKVTENGPILVNGQTVLTKNGEKLNVSENYALCGCGKSKNSPMCDGTHKNHTCNNNHKN